MQHPRSFESPFHFQHSRSAKILVSSHALHEKQHEKFGTLRSRINVGPKASWAPWASEVHAISLDPPSLLHYLSSLGGYLLLVNDCTHTVHLPCTDMLID